MRGLRGTRTFHLFHLFCKFPWILAWFGFVGVALLVCLFLLAFAFGEICFLSSLIPVVDRQCLALVRQCRGKKKSSFCCNCCNTTEAQWAGNQTCKVSAWQVPPNHVMYPSIEQVGDDLCQNLKPCHMLLNDERTIRLVKEAFRVQLLEFEKMGYTLQFEKGSPSSVKLCMFLTQLFFTGAGFQENPKGDCDRVSDSSPQLCGFHAAAFLYPSFGSMGVVVMAGIRVGTEMIARTFIAKSIKLCLPITISMILGCLSNWCTKGRECLLSQWLINPLKVSCLRVKPRI